MKITFTTVFSKQSKEKITYNLVRAEVAPDEEKHAMENGWIYLDGGWYQARTVRIDLAKHVVKNKWPKKLEFKIGTLDDFDKDSLTQIYKDYIAYKNFSDCYNPITNDLLYPPVYGVVFENSIPVAFTKFSKFNGTLESYMFCWNYHNPKLSIGKIIQDKEVEYAKSLGLTHLYIGEGSERGCIYKASIPGFEWWTGSEWSTDKEKYIKLCERDSDLVTIAELDDIDMDI